jgi:hypothetical protein
MGNTDGFRIDQNGCLHTLSEHIERRLKEREFCVVFEDEVERCWPREKLGRTEREEQIQAFAKSRGWSASILNFDSGHTRALFLRF